MIQTNTCLHECACLCSDIENTPDKCVTKYCVSVTGIIVGPAAAHLSSPAARTSHSTQCEEYTVPQHTASGFQWPNAASTHPPVNASVTLHGTKSHRTKAEGKSLTTHPPVSTPVPWPSCAPKPGPQNVQSSPLSVGAGYYPMTIDEAPPCCPESFRERPGPRPSAAKLSVPGVMQSIDSSKLQAKGASNLPGVTTATSP